MPRLLLFVSLSLFALVGCWLLLQSSSPEATGADPSARPVAGSEAIPPAAAARAPVDAARVPLPDAPPARTPPAAAVAVEVTVVDAATSQPVAGADVCWLDAAVWPRVQALPEAERGPYYQDHERTARRFGGNGRSGADGRLRVPVPGDGCTVFARQGDRFGSVDAQPEHARGGLVLLLAPDRTLLVRVVDHANRPQGRVLVALTLHDAAGRDLGVGFPGSVCSTDADGNAVFRHLQQGCTAVGGAPSTWRAGVRLPCIDGCSQAFDPAAPPAAGIELVLPAAGSILAHLVHCGRPLAGVEAGATLQALGGPRLTSWSSDRTDDGIVRLSHVPLDRRFVVTLHVDDLELTQEVAGPTAPDQEVHATFAVPDECTVLTGRAVDADGRPLAAAHLTTEFAMSRLGGSSYLDCDRHGRFTWFLDAWQQDDALQRLLLQCARDGVLLRAEVPPRPLAAGSNDLGDVVLVPLPLIVAGRFAPPVAESARIDLAIERWQQPGADGDGGWQPVEDLAIGLDAERFRIRGRAPAGRLRLRCFSAQHLPVPPLEFAPGRDDLLLELVAGERLQVQAELPPGMAAGSLRFELVPAAALAGECQDRLLGEAEGPVGSASVRWQALPAGRYALQVRAHGVADLLAELPRLQLPAPPGGYRFDLRERLPSLQLRVGPGELEGVRVWLDPAAGSSSEHRLDAGVRCLPLPPRPVDVLVGCPGWRPQLLRAQPGELAVQLQPWPQVQVSVRGLPPLPEGVQLLLDLEPGDGGERRWFGGDGEATNWVLEPPRRGLALVQDGDGALAIGDAPRRVVAVMELGNRVLPLQSFTPTVVTPGVPAVTVQVAADEVRRALEQLSRR